MKKTNYAHTLSDEKLKELKNELISQGITDQDLENALESRLCDLEEIVDLEKYL